MDKKKSKQKKGFNINPQHINKRGAPKKNMTLTGCIRGILETRQAIIRIDGKKQKKLLMEILAEKVTKMVLEGDKYILKTLWNYLDGMPRESVEHSGTVSGNIIINRTKSKKPDG